MRFCFNKLGLPVVGEVKAPGYLEGEPSPPRCLLPAYRGGRASAATFAARPSLHVARCTGQRVLSLRSSCRCGLACYGSGAGPASLTRSA
jgi:hypothetical protein